MTSLQRHFSCFSFHCYLQQYMLLWGAVHATLLYMLHATEFKKKKKKELVSRNTDFEND